MSRTRIIGKSLLLSLMLIFVIRFSADLLYVSTTGSLLERLLLTTPVIIALRLAFIFAAFGLAGWVVVVFWKQIGVIKISSTGIEFGKLDDISAQTTAELAANKEKIRILEAEIKALRKEKEKLQKLVTILEVKEKGQEL